MTIVSAPVAAVNLFADPVLAQPYEAYRAIRDAGPVVYLPEHRLWVLARYDQVREALHRPDVFRAARGTGLFDILTTETLSPVSAPAASTNDPLTAMFAPRALSSLETVIVNQAERLVDDLIAYGSFDAVADLAHPYPLKTIGDLIGLSADARTDLMTCAEASLQVNAPLDDHILRALMDLEGVFTFLTGELSASRTPTATAPCRPTSTRTARPLPSSGIPRAATHYSATPCAAATAPAGPTVHDPTTHLLKIFALPCVHAIASGLSGMLWLLATHPEAWHALRATPSLAAAAVEECLRLEPPVTMLSRITTRDVLIADTLIRAGDRVLLLPAAANRDPRKWPNPDHFDIRRNPTDHLSLGPGTHSPLTATLTRTHLRATLAALATRAATLHLDGSPRYRITSTTRTFASLPLYATRR